MPVERRKRQHLCFLAIFQGDASSKRDTFSIRILATRFSFMVSRSQCLKITQNVSFYIRPKMDLNGPKLKLDLDMIFWHENANEVILG